MTEPMIYPYSRVSETSQVKGSGLGIQLNQNVLESLSEQYKLPICEEVMSDVGKSAFHGKHLEHELGAFLSSVKDGSVSKGSILVVYSLDRLSRLQLGFAKQIYLDLTNNGIHIYSILDNHLYQAHNVADEIVSSIVFERAHNESSTKSKRVTDTLLKRVKEHQELHVKGEPAKALPMPLPWWVVLKDGYIYLDEKKANLVRKIVEMSIKGMGVLSILEQLKSFCDDSYISSTISYGTISRLHKRKTLFGEYSLTIDGVVYSLSDYIPPVISEATYWQFVEAKQRRTHSRSTQTQRSLLTGYSACKCRHCGGSLSGTLKGGKVRLYCVNGLHDKSKCSYWSVTSEPLERAILSNMGFLLRVPPEPIEDKSKAILLAVEDVQARLNQVEADYLASPSNVLAKVLNQLEQELAAKKEEYEVAVKEHVNSEPVGMLTIPSDELGKRELLRRSFEQMSIYRHKKFHYLISLYSKRGLIQHIYIAKEKVIKVGQIYQDLSQEEHLRDWKNFLLWVAGGHLDKWLITEYELDFSEPENTD